MIQFKTKYTNVTVDGIFTINKKGKYPLHEEYLCIHNTEWKVTTENIFLKVGAYIIDIKVKNSDKMVELIKKHLRMPMDFMINETIIHCESISIKEW